MAKKDVAVRHFWLTICFLLGIFAVQSFGAHVVARGMDLWYFQLKTPNWTPPERMLPLVWLFLYFIIAFTGYFIWTRPQSPIRTKAFAFWAAQLVANFLWICLFFRLKSPLLAGLDLLILIALIIGLIVTVRKMDEVISYLILPYLLWVVYAFALNVAICLMN